MRLVRMCNSNPTAIRQRSNTTLNLIEQKRESYMVASQNLKQHHPDNNTVLTDMEGHVNEVKERADTIAKEGNNVALELVNCKDQSLYFTDLILPVLVIGDIPVLTIFFTLLRLFKDKDYKFLLDYYLEKGYNFCRCKLTTIITKLTKK